MKPFGKVTAVLTYANQHPLGGLTPSRTLARVAKWQIRSRISDRPVTHRWVNDSVLVVNRHMFGATGNVYFGLHEFPDMGFFLHALRPEDLFLDVGANVGSYTVLASAVAGATTWAFEPDPETARLLTRNLLANAISDRVKVFEVAVGSENGEVEFTVGLDTVNRILPGGEPGSRRRVPIRRLDDVLGGLVPAFMKVDVEGFELQVFEGAQQTLRDRRLLAIQAETVDSRTLALFEDAGFEQRYYDPFTRELSLLLVDGLAHNQLFVRPGPAIEQRVREAAPFRVLGRSI